jgi:hypothetical protein
MRGIRGWSEGLGARLFELPSVVADYTIGTAIVLVQLMVRGPSQAEVDARPRRLMAGNR